MPKQPDPICPYCDNPAKLMLDSTPVYGQNYGPIWACLPCDAWVGTHKNSPSHVALGRLANKELRRAKRPAHEFFDPLWKRKQERDNCTKFQARNAAYIWLAEQLGIKRAACHIGMFDVEQCRRVVEICAPVRIALDRIYTDGKPRRTGFSLLDNAP